MKKAGVTEETYIRHLPYSIVMKLATILDIDNAWEQLAARIPVKPDYIFHAADGEFEPRYTMGHIARLNDKGRIRGGSSTKALFVDWGTQNSKVKHLIEALCQADLKLAVDYLKKDLLHISPQENNLSKQASGDEKTMKSGPPSLNRAPSNTSSCTTDNNESTTSDTRRYHEVVTEQLGLSERRNGGLLISEGAGDQANATVSVASTQYSQATMDDRMSHGSAAVKSCGLKDEAPTSPVSESAMGSEKKQICLEDLGISLEDIDKLKAIRFDLLSSITNHFDNRNLKDGGNLIGEGGFGTVFVGTFNNGYKVAIKCLKDNTDDSLEQFKTEVETLGRFKHDNLVYLLGYSADGDNPRCLVYQYMPNGSLEERLACRFGTQPLSNNMRFEIIRGTARGLEFLHTEGLVHRDVKSANILLDAEFNPKVGDFATARVLPTGMTTKILKASVVIGTQAYLAPEALSFVIHPSLDVFSFGVVILEVLTGLPVIDHHREDVDLKVLVQEHCSEGDEDEEPGTIFDLLDARGGEWSKDIVDFLYEMSCRCLEVKSKLRPKMKHILSELDEKVVGKINEAG